MMCMRRHVVAFALAVAGLLTTLAADKPVVVCGTAGNYSANSTYEGNLRLVAAGLPTNISTSPGLFATAANGAEPDKVYAVGICRGDQDPSACQACIAPTFKDAQDLCPYDRGATIFYDTCILSFSDRDQLVSPTNSNDEVMRLYNDRNLTSSDVGQFNAAVYKLLDALVEYLETIDSVRRFATGTIGFDATYPIIYSMVWCTPDLTHRQCRACLTATVARMPYTFIPNTQGATITGLRCSARYEVHPFYKGVTMLQLPGTSAGKKSNETSKILSIVLPSVAALLVSIVACLCWRRRTESKKLLAYGSHMEGIDCIESLIIDLPTLRIATDNFAENHKLGEGGFGAVYKGSLPGGQDIAVKRLSQCSQQGIGELKNELVLISNLQHKNLVRLIGVCLQDDEKLLVYEYMPNKSLDTFLFDSEKRKELHWGKRLSIIDGIAHGLQYLHEDSLLKIVHRDLKASNILLDADMNPKISDFGLAKLFGGDQSQDTTNRVVGTYGYMAPEYALRGRYSIKSDIYSFGVLILEILTGRKNSDSYISDQFIDLPSLVWECWTMESIMEMIDPYLRGDSSQDEILRCVHIGLSCVQEDPAERPTIWTINVMLDSNTIPSHPPSKPAFYVEMGGNIVSGGINDSTPKSNAMSLNELSITDPEPR